MWTYIISYLIILYLCLEVLLQEHWWLLRPHRLAEFTPLWRAHLIAVGFSMPTSGMNDHDFGILLAFSFCGLYLVRVHTSHTSCSICSKISCCCRCSHCMSPGTQWCLSFFFVSWCPLQRGWLVLACLGKTVLVGKMIDFPFVKQVLLVDIGWLVEHLSLSVMCHAIVQACSSFVSLFSIRAVATVSYQGALRIFTHKRKHARCTRCTLVISSCGKKFFQISILSIRCVSAKMAAHPVVPCLESGPCWKHLLPLASTCHFCARAHNMPLCWLWTKLVATPCSRDT